MIAFEQVSKVYADGTKAVNKLSFKVEKGEFFVLIGPSGCGKTTTLKMINRLIEPSSGAIFIGGQHTARVNIHELRWNIGYVLQQIALFPNMSVAENIGIVPEMKQWKKSTIEKRVDELLDLVGLEPKIYRERMPSDLSGGQQQRVGVARALAADPDILLMDEPFSALDPLSRSQLQQDIKALQQTIQKTVVFVTHDMEEAAKLGNRIGVMEKGEIVQIGSAQELRENPQTSLVKEMMGRTISPGNMPLKDVMMPVYKSAYVKERANTDQAELQYEVNHKQELIRAFYHGVLLDDPLTLNRDSTLEQAFEALQKQGVPALPVKEGNQLIGTISYEDMAKLSLKTL